MALAHLVPGYSLLQRNRATVTLPSIREGIDPFSTPRIQPWVNQQSQHHSLTKEGLQYTNTKAGVGEGTQTSFYPLDSDLDSANVAKIQNRARDLYPFSTGIQ